MHSHGFNNGLKLLWEKNNRLIVSVKPSKQQPLDSYLRADFLPALDEPCARFKPLHSFAIWSYFSDTTPHHIIIAPFPLGGPSTCETVRWRTGVKNNKTLSRWIGGQIHLHQLAPGNRNEEDGPVIGCDVVIELPVGGEPGGWPSGLMHPPYVDMAFFGQAHHGTIGVVRGGGGNELGDATRAIAVAGPHAGEWTGADDGAGQRLVKANLFAADARGASRGRCRIWRPPPALWVHLHQNERRVARVCSVLVTIRAYDPIF